MQSRTIWTDCFFVALAGLVFFCAFLGGYHLIVPDEGRYIEVAREMVATHNYITPFLNGTAFLDKPILYYWLESLLIQSFGLNEWSVRLLPVFFGMMGAVLAYLAGYFLYQSRRTGWLAALILMTNFLYFLSSHYADMDLMLAILLSGALWFFIIALNAKVKHQGLCFYIAYIFSALAFLTKGLMGIVFPAMIIGLWIVFSNRWHVILKMRLVSGLLLFGVLVAPWFALVQKQNPEFLYYFFVIQQFSRYVTSNFNLHQPFYYYFLVVLIGFFPWVLFLFQSFFSAFKSVKQKKSSASTDLFLLIWTVAIFIFFSIPQSKVTGYILPIFPPMALLVARYLDQNWCKLPKSLSLKWVSFVFLLIGVVASLVIIFVSQMPNLTTEEVNYYLFLVSMIVMCGSVTTVFFSVYHKNLLPTLILIGGTAILCEITAIAAAPSLKLNTSKPVALYILEHQSKNRLVASYHSYFQDLPVYLQQKIYVVYNWSDPSIAEHDNWRRELAEDILYKHQAQPYLIDDENLAVLWKTRSMYVILDTKKIPEIRGLLNGKIYVVHQYDKLSVISNSPDN